jgi:poly-gamma-glutamate capsule biosynthesis protein CapA/YwtB (metallophosphatase superfamily)
MRLCFLLIIVLITFNPTFSQPDSIINNTPDTIIIGKTISIIGVGDIMPGTNYPSVKYLPPNNNPWPLLENVAPVLKTADLTIGNLEGCLSDNAPLHKTCRDTTKCYVFRIPAAYGQTLKDAGINVLTIANNHSGDFGDAGRQSTVNILNNLEIYHAGWIKYPTAEFTKDSIRYGIASFAPNSGTVPLNDIKGAMAIVADLKTRCNIVIVTFHGGAEGKDHQRITRKTEEFYGENRGNVYEFARKVIDAGADVVFGHGPHVPRAIDIYKNRFIAYSLGNFCTYNRFNLLPPNNIAPIVKININTKGELIDGQIISALQIGEGITILDTNKPGKAVSTIRQLTQTDIPELKIIISDDGFFKNPFCE